MKLQRSVRSRLLTAAGCVALAAVAHAGAAGVESPNGPRLSAWAGDVWSSARAGDESHVLERLTRRDADADKPIGLSSSIESFRTNLDKRDQERAEQVEKARSELREHFEASREKDEAIQANIALGMALRAAVQMQMLMRDDHALLQDELVTELMRAAKKAAHAAEERGDWLTANELFVRLNTLSERDRTYEDDVTRLGKRLAMIRLYTPERLWTLRNDRRLAEGENPFPPYNPFGDRYEDKLAEVSRGMVIRGVQRSAMQNVEGVSLADMLIGGLDAVETMTTTTDLEAVFPGMSRADARRRMVARISDLRENVRARNDNATSRDLQNVVDGVLRANRDTIGVLENAILHEFGNGAMGVLDEYSAIVWPDEIARFRRTTQGEFIGVGIQIQLDDLQNIRVVTPLEGTPAQRAGIRSDDIIKKVDGLSTIGFTLDQAVEVITGPADSTVTLTLEREQADGKVEELEFPIVRQRIPLRTVRGWRKTGPGDYDWDYFIDPEAGVGYVRLANFTEETTRDFDRAVSEMRAQGLNGLILDLRFNPGGLLDQAVGIANRFVDRGLIVRIEDASGNTRNQEFARPIPSDRSLKDVPVVVLINEGAASASEIVSGAVQAASVKGRLRALVVGQRSFGKGSVQNVYPLEGGRAALKLTTQYYRLDSDRLIHRMPGAEEWGVEPDLRIEMLPEQITSSIILRREADVLPLDEHGNIIEDAERPDPDTLLTDGKDLQLQAALVLLQTQSPAERVAVRSAATAPGERE